jgi:uncharacterized OsmC-like protein
MSQLQDYLTQKREALLARRARAATTEPAPQSLTARVRAEGRSGIRRIRIRDFQILSDSGPDFAGYDLGPTSPELQLGVLGSCLTHIFLIQAADREVPLDAIEVEVTAQVDPRAGKPGFEHVPIYPHRIAYTVEIESPASDEEIDQLHAAVERACPILNLLLNPQQIEGTVVRRAGSEAAPLATAARG